MIYWHVEKKNVCIYSQLKSCSSSEFAAMIEGLLRHCTDAEIESNYADTHGASVVGSRSPSCSTSACCPG
ncbi:MULTISPECIES: Tn3 family transposase [Streptomyces]|uniref:Tn3 family transposase n=1 Tax=Streptomyces TaxID=1883 RepID=UPI00069808D4